MTWTAEEIAARVAADIEDEWIVNLGVGMPTLVAERLYGSAGARAFGERNPGCRRCRLPRSEDSEVIDPGKNPVTSCPGPPSWIRRPRSR